MHILVITHTTPNLPSKDGLTLILYHLQKELTQHTFTIVARDLYETDETFIQTILEKSSEHDVVYLHGPDMMTYIPQLTVNFKNKLVAGLIDTPSLKYQQLKELETSSLQRRKWNKLEHDWRQQEQAWLNQVRFIIVGSPADRLALLNHVSGQPFISVIPNGVDSDYFAPEPTIPAEFAMVFSGSFEQASHNQAVLRFAKEVWPQLTAIPELAELEWYIVGRDPSKKIQQLGKKNQRIHVTGFVPEVKQFLVRCKVFVSPLKLRSGVRNTLLEAMACGLPVVAYSSACAGLEQSPIRKVSTANDFAQTVQQLLSDETQRNQIGELHRQYVCHHHQWAKQAQLYENVFKQTAQ